MLSGVNSARGKALFFFHSNMVAHASGSPTNESVLAHLRFTNSRKLDARGTLHELPFRRRGRFRHVQA